MVDEYIKVYSGRVDNVLRELGRVIYVFTCPVCGRKIPGFSYEGVALRASKHYYSHFRKKAGKKESAGTGVV